MEEMTRRRFMGGSALVIGSAALGVSAGEALLPGPAQAAKKHFVETGCGREGADRRSILVAYASMNGSTGEVAEAIGRALCGANLTVDIRPVENVEEVEGYDGYVIGSAIRSDKWLPPARRFVEENRDSLASAPTAYFLTCLTLATPGPEPLRLAKAMLDPVLESVPEVKPVGLGLFAGVLDYGKYNFAVRMVMKRKMRAKGVKEGDYRDWDRIAAWTRTLQPSFANPAGIRDKAA